MASSGEVAASDAEAANFDQPGEFARRPDHESPVLASRWTRSSPTSTADGSWPERPAKDEIEREMRFAGT
jgi:hypothetical protein